MKNSKEKTKLGAKKWRSEKVLISLFIKVLPAKIYTEKNIYEDVLVKFSCYTQYFTRNRIFIEKNHFF